MTAAVAGMTGKTGVPLFLAHKNQREGGDKNKRKIYIVCKFPGISGFYGMGHPPFVCWNVRLWPRYCGI